MTTPERQVPPGSTIGILGGGQLGRMLAMAAARLGYKCHIFAPEAENPAYDVCARHTVARYDDEAALAAFAASVDVITYEFENVPAATAAFLAARNAVRPGPDILAATQDRLIEKQFLGSLGIPVAPFAQVDDPGALARAVAQIGRPAILKTRRFGYDGKGQATIREGSDLSGVFRSLGAQPCILEGVVPFLREVSVVAARGLDGSLRAFDLCENRHENHILARTTVPARVKPETARAAVAMTEKIADALDYVGVLAVEMFVTLEWDAAGKLQAESLRVNEIAPRVHNSGHWTLDGAATSQFEQHIRAICGLPLGSTRRYGAIVMDNLTGDDVLRWQDILEEDGASLHLYGKGAPRPGRKMGHMTRVVPEG